MAWSPQLGRARGPAGRCPGEYRASCLCLGAVVLLFCALEANSEMAPSLIDWKACFWGPPSRIHMVPSFLTWGRRLSSGCSGFSCLNPALRVLELTTAPAPCPWGTRACLPHRVFGLGSESEVILKKNNSFPRTTWWRAFSFYILCPLG